MSTTMVDTTKQDATDAPIPCAPVRSRLFTAPARDATTAPVASDDDDDDDDDDEQITSPRLSRPDLPRRRS